MRRRVGNWTGRHTRQITKEEMKKYGERFKFIRLDMGLNKVEMADVIGTHQASIRRWENAEAIPNRPIHELLEEYERIYAYWKRKVG